MERSEVYKLIDLEREYQDNLAKDGKIEEVIHSVGAEILIISEYADKAKAAWVDTYGDEAGLEVIRKIAAVCVRCMEHHGGRGRLWP